MKENVERCGATPIMVTDRWGDPVDPEKLEAAINAHPDAKVVAFVHAETSTGVRSDAQTLCRLAKSAGMLVIMDAVTSLAGIDLKTDLWGADVVYSGTQKCLSGLPGISPITFSEDAVATILDVSAVDPPDEHHVGGRKSEPAIDGGVDARTRGPTSRVVSR